MSREDDIQEAWRRFGATFNFSEGSAWRVALFKPIRVSDRNDPVEPAPIDTLEFKHRVDFSEDGRSRRDRIVCEGIVVAERIDRV